MFTENRLELIRIIEKNKRVKSERQLPDHPCMNSVSHNNMARLHLPVASNCNIMCRYCERQVCPANIHETCPGISAVLLSPSQAFDRASEFLNEWGPRSIIGISGPGDPLANDETFLTMKYIKKEYPHARLCLCTNGFALPDNLEIIRSLGIQHITVTVNAVDPEIGKYVYRWVRNDGIKYTGIEGANLLLRNQLLGISRAISAGIFVKINTVVIPGINADHVNEISKSMAAVGCCVHNIVPLIPRGEFKDLTKPEKHVMQDIRLRSGAHLPVLSNCRQCRADAVGIPGREECCDKN